MLRCDHCKIDHKSGPVPDRVREVLYKVSATDIKGGETVLNSNVWTGDLCNACQAELNGLIIKTIDRYVSSLINRCTYPECSARVKEYGQRCANH